LCICLLPWEPGNLVTDISDSATKRPLDPWIWTKIAAQAQQRRMQQQRASVSGFPRFFARQATNNSAAALSSATQCT
jgi:hypothetical protein